MCGLFGIIASRPIVAEAYDALLCLQHRGQDAAGILTFDESSTQLHLCRGDGLVRDAFKPRDLERLPGHLGLGHTRYPTVGGGTVEDAQPCMCNSPYGIALVHNGNLSNFHALKSTLFLESGRYIGSSCDAEVLLNLLADELPGHTKLGLQPEDVFSAVKGIFSRARGAYSAASLIAGQGMLAFRDPYGIRPIVMGRRRGPRGEFEYAFASESGCLTLLGFTEIEDLENGEAVWVDMQRRLHRKRVVEQVHRPCIFEWVYLARPDALIDGISVYKARRRAGVKLTELWLESGLDADVVIPVPDSSRTAAHELARVLDVPYREGLVKNRYIGRTFIMPGVTDRRKSVRNKLNPIPLEFEGKRVLLVDDSIVRGNTSRELVKMARQAGAIKVYLASYSPPLKHPCVYGIDMSTRNEFIARNNSVEEICRLIGADHLVYQTIDRLEESVRRGNPQKEAFCTACFTGEYPTGDITPQMLARWELDRTNAGTHPLLPFGTGSAQDRGTSPAS